MYYIPKCRTPDIKMDRRSEDFLNIHDNICLPRCSSNPARMNEDASHYTTLAGNCFERHFGIFQSLT